MVYHTRYRKDCKRKEKYIQFAFFACTPTPIKCILIKHNCSYELTLSVNTTPIFQMWYFVSMELNLREEGAHSLSLTRLYFTEFLSIRVCISHQDTSEASLAIVSSVGLKSRALLSRPSNSAIRSAPYKSPYLFITYRITVSITHKKGLVSCFTHIYIYMAVTVFTLQWNKIEMLSIIREFKCHK